MTEAHNARQPKLRVAMATKFPYSESDSYSGLFQVSQNLSNALAQRSDIELFVVSGSDQVEQIEHRQINNYQVTFFPYGSDLSYYGSFYLFASNAMKRELLQIQPDIVHCQAVADTALGSLLTHIPMVATIHGIAAAELATARSLRVKLAYRVQALVESWYVPRFKHVISCSPYVTEFVQRKNRQAKLYEISNPMDPIFFQTSLAQTNPQPYTILLLGAISYRKGHDLMINAMPAILREFGDARLTIIGKEVDPSFADAVRQKIQKYKLSNHVRWLGSVNQETLLHEMKQHQIVCLPSREDTLPMAISQAMIVGNIPVTSNAGGMPQMIEDGKNGFLFSAGDSTALSRTLERVFKQSNVELQRMRVRNREFADKTYHPNNVADQTVSVYRSILGK